MSAGRLLTMRSTRGSTASRRALSCHCCIKHGSTWRRRTRFGICGKKDGKSLINACFWAVSRCRMVSMKRRARSSRSSLKYPASTTSLTGGLDSASWLSMRRMISCTCAHEHGRPLSTTLIHYWAQTFLTVHCSNDMQAVPSQSLCWE